MKRQQMCIRDRPYTGPQYWPQGKKVSFFAYAPATDVTYVAPTGAGWPGFTSVSYTHLDVYKRQVQERSGSK